VLGTLFSMPRHGARRCYPAPSLTGYENAQTLLGAYESLRLSRAKETQLSSSLNRNIFHLPDGPEQEARDADMRSGAGKGSANQWADKDKNEEQFGYDAEKEALRWLHANSGDSLMQIEDSARIESPGCHSTAVCV
jgi:salicylate hydroxylase